VDEAFQRVILDRFNRQDKKLEEIAKDVRAQKTGSGICIRKHEAAKEWREGHEEDHGIKKKQKAPPSVWVANLAAYAWHNPKRTGFLVGLVILLFTPPSLRGQVLAFGARFFRGWF